MAIKRPLTASDVIVESIVAAPIGALVGGASGIVGRGAISFFNPAVATAAGTLGTFAGVGLIAAPLMVIPNYITRHLLSQSEFLKKHPNFAAILEDTSEYLYTLGAVAVGAGLISSAILPTMAAMMLVPSIVYALHLICNVINACLGVSPKKDQSEVVEPVAAPAMR